MDAGIVVDVVVAGLVVFKTLIPAILQTHPIVAVVPDPLRVAAEPGTETEQLGMTTATAAVEEDLVPHPHPEGRDTTADHRRGDELVLLLNFILPETIAHHGLAMTIGDDSCR